jgi:hypothetical protein
MSDVLSVPRLSSCLCSQMIAENKETKTTPSAAEYDLDDGIPLYPMWSWPGLILMITCTLLIFITVAKTTNIVAWYLMVGFWTFVVMLTAPRCQGLQVNRLRRISLLQCFWPRPHPVYFSDLSESKRINASGLFPDFTPRWQKVDLNALYLQHKDLNMQNPQDQIKLLELANQGNKDIALYGGFGENRAEIWKRLPPDVYPYTHLGVDFNHLKVGQPVHSLTDGSILHSWVDRSRSDGWGGRVIVYCNKKGLYVLYGHLDPHHLPKNETRIEKGERIGIIGDPKENGGWFPHLHLQVMTIEFIKQWLDRLDSLDGYEWHCVDIPKGVIDPMILF